MQKNKTGQYFKYAIGEILLVVIGILIAFTINTWNEQRKQSEDERIFLQALLNDLEQQQIRLTTQAEWEVEKLNFVDSSVILIETSRLTENADTLFYYMQRLNPRMTFDVFNPTFEELKSTGNFKLIADKELRKEIILFYQNLERRSQTIANNNFNIDNIYKPFFVHNRAGFYKNSKRQTVIDLNQDPKRSMELDNAMRMRRSLANSNLVRSQNAISELSILKEHIHHYLSDQ